MKRFQLFGNPRVPIWRQGPVDWTESVGVELSVTWGQVAQWVWDVPHMRYMRGQTIWLEGTQDDIRDRKRALLAMARGLISTRGQGGEELDELYPLLPVESISPRLANLVCVAYKDAPERTFSADDSVNKGFDDLYDELNVNETMDVAYRSALFTNTVLILWSEEEKKFLVLTPEYFRIGPGGEIWVARRVGTDIPDPNSNGWDKKGEIVYDVWTDTTHEVRTGGGKIRVSECEENPYGMFPGALMKLTPSNDIYGAGIVESAEINLASNLVRLFGLRTAVHQGFSVAVMKNFYAEAGGSSPKNGIRIGPGKVLDMKNVSGDASGEPSFEYVSPSPQFEGLEKYRREIIASFERNQDLPGFLIDENAGSPPTGVALQVLERQLNNRRRDHLTALRRTEKRLSKFIEKLAQLRKRQKLVIEDFEIAYAAPQMFVDPAQEYTYDRQRASDGLYSPSAFAQKYLGVKRGQTDVEAAAQITENKQFFSFLTLTPTTNTNGS